VNSPLITVYIPSHSYGRFLANAIDSVLRQSYENWELIVIDDGSTDSTADVMNLYRGHPQISLHRTIGIGLPAVCNFALSEAKGDCIIRLDSDDVFDENILLVLGTHLMKNPNVALVFPDYYLLDDFGEIYAHETRQRLYQDNHMLDMPPHGACTLIRKKVLEELGGYRLDLGVQDGFDLWSRIRSKYKIANVSLPLFYYRRHGKNLTTNTHRILAARRQIKKDAIHEKIKGFPTVTAVIPCRRNYDFVTDLWKRQINGKTLLERDIEVCLASDIIDRVVVTCDNPDIEDVVRQYNDERLNFFLRDTKSTIPTSSIVPTLESIVSSFDPGLEGITVLRFIQTPFVTTDTLDEAVTSLIMNDADSSYGVEAINSKLFRRTPHGLEALNQDKVIYSDFDTIFRDANTFTAVLNRNFARGTLTGSSVVSFEVSAAECFFIDSEQRIKIAEMLDNKYE